jgi:hypothetical protein
MKQKHFSIYALSLMAGLALTVACSGDDDKNSNQSSAFDGRLSGTITTESGAALNGEIDELLVSYFYGNSSQTYTVTANGAFDFTLSTPVASDLYLLAEDVPNGLRITPVDVKCATFDQIYARRNENNVGPVLKSKKTTTLEVLLTYTYANKVAVATGTKDDGDWVYTYNMNLAAGWNIVVVKKEISGKKYHVSFTTGNVPTDLQWTFSGYGADGYAVGRYEPQVAKTGFGLFGK